MEMVGGSLFIKMKDGSEYDINEFDGYCEEKELAGRHFSGNCTWTYDLTEEDEVLPEYQGMYYLHGYADGDWGTEFSDFSFVSNEVLQSAKDNQLNLYQFHEDCYYGEIESTFLATKEQVLAKLDSTISLGEVLGKHSEVEVELTEASVTLLSEDQVLVEKLKEAMKGSNLISGYDVFGVDE